MDTQGHQPGEELADFTEGELLSLIDAGTAGAFSEIYRRYIDDAVARASASGPQANARQVADDAFLGVLRSVLNKTADTSQGLQSMVHDAIDERRADAKSPNGAHWPERSSPADDASGGSASANDTDEHDRVRAAQALSTLPDNWQRILWLREVEQLSPQAVADQLNITATVVDRLSVRARENLQKEWDRTRADDDNGAADHRSVLVPALLASPIVIERLADTIAQTAPEPAVPNPTSPGAVPERNPISPGAVPEPTGPVAASTAPDESATDQSVADETIVIPPSEETSGGPAPSEETSGGPSPDDKTPLAAYGTREGDPDPEAETQRSPAKPVFSMPKPVLIPVVAACIGLLGTLVGLAIVPQHAEQAGFRPGSGASSIAPADSSSGEKGRSADSQSSETSTSGKDGQEPGSENAQEPKPNNSTDDRDEDTSSSDSSRNNDGRTGEDSPTDDDSGDQPSPNRPDDPRPSDSDRPDPDSPSGPGAPSEPETPSEPDEPESPSEPEPSEPDEPTPSDEPEPTPSDEPDEPTPSEPEPTETEPEPTPSDSDGSSPGPTSSSSEEPSDSGSTHDGPSTGTSTPSN